MARHPADPPSESYLRGYGPTKAHLFGAEPAAFTPANAFRLAVIWTILIGPTLTGEGEHGLVARPILAESRARGHTNSNLGTRSDGHESRSGAEMRKRWRHRGASRCCGFTSGSFSGLILGWVLIGLASFIAPRRVLAMEGFLEVTCWDRSFQQSCAELELEYGLPGREREAGGGRSSRGTEKQ